MTFEIAFTYQEVLYKADVTVSGKDLLVNLTSPAIYETAQTMAFTIHDDESMKYDNSMFEDNDFMPAIETAITDYMHSHNIVIE